ncbi:MAG: chromate transporter [Proteobacteria bacterium]|nr:chromate transporter [Pseudomonadota bacterium]
MSPEGARNVPRSPGELFYAFMKLGLQGFGGVLPVARHTLVDSYRWLSMDEFTDIVSRCQALPGPNIVNVSICIGARHFGARGALAACGGILAVPFVMVLMLGVLYSGYAQLPAVAAALRGVSAVAAGLIIATALRMAGSKRLRSWRAAFGIAAFAAVSVLRLPLALVLAVAVPLSIAAAWFGRKAAP